MELAKLEKFYRIHVKFYDWTRRWFLFDRERAIEALEVRKGDKIFDFACGTGLNVPFLIKKGVEVTGIDYSESMLERARKKYPAVKFVQGDITKYRFDEKANGIICTYSLSMVENWQEAILNMKNSLREDGRLVILDFYHPWRGIFKVFYPLFRWWLRKHGVDAEKQIIPFLKEHFHQVEVKVKRGGYNFLAVAK